MAAPLCIGGDLEICRDLRLREVVHSHAAAVARRWRPERLRANIIEPRLVRRRPVEGSDHAPAGEKFTKFHALGLAGGATMNVDQ